jgi:hypothetical protein
MKTDTSVDCIGTPVIGVLAYRKPRQRSEQRDGKKHGADNGHGKIEFLPDIH